jgi:hypothetical protein
MSTKIQLRRDTASAWTSANPALAAGEIGYETDTRNIKIGDGTTLWNSLKYQAPYYTAANSGAASTLLALDVANNRVGIGTTSPANKLQVDTTSLTAEGVQIRNLNSTAYSQFLSAGQTGVPGSGVPANSVLIEGVPFSTANTHISAYTNSLVFQTSARIERMRIDSAGLVGIGTASPASTLDVAGGQIRFRSTGAYSQPGVGTGAIYYDADAGNLTLDARSPGGNTALLFRTSDGGTGGQRMSISSTGVTVSGLITADGGVTIPSGDTLTVASGATLSLPTTGTLVLNGAAIQANTVALTKLSQSSTPVLLGTPSGTSTATDVSALTQAQARTMLGLVAPAYTAPNTSITAWTDLALNTASTVNKDLDVTTLVVGVLYAVPIAFTRATGSNPVWARVVLEAGESLIIHGGSDTVGASAATNWASNSGNYYAWYRRGLIKVIASGATGDENNSDYPCPYIMSGAQTQPIFRWEQPSGTTGGPRATVVMTRLS